MGARVEQADPRQSCEQGPHGVGHEAIGMKDEVDLSGSVSRQHLQRRGDRRQPVVPAFAPMTSHEYSSLTAFVHSRSGKPCLGINHGIYAGVASDMDFARDQFGAEILGCNISGSEQELGIGIDCGAIFLLGPWQIGSWVLRPASTWATGTPAVKAASAAPSALDVSPCTTRRSGGARSSRRSSLVTARTCA